MLEISIILFLFQPSFEATESFKGVLLLVLFVLQLLQEATFNR